MVVFIYVIWFKVDEDGWLFYIYSWDVFLVWFFYLNLRLFFAVILNKFNHKINVQILLVPIRLLLSDRLGYCRDGYTKEYGLKISNSHGH